MWIASVIAMLLWSGTDFFNKAGTEQGDKFSHYKIGISVGLVMGIHALYTIFTSDIRIGIFDIVRYLPASLMYISSMVVGYIGLRYIEISVLSPICNGSGAVALIMSMLYFGVTFVPDSDSGAIFLNFPIIAAVILIVAGIIYLGIVEKKEDPYLREERQKISGRKYSKSPLAILLPVIYCILDSLGTFADAVIADTYVSDFTAGGMNEEKAIDYAGDILNTSYELTWLFIAIIFFVYVFIIKNNRINLKYDSLKLTGSICETLGQFFYVLVVVSGFKLGLVIVSAYCAVSLLWGRIFLKERLSLKHYMAIAVVFTGIIILGFFDI